MTSPHFAKQTAAGRIYQFKGEYFDSVTTIIGGGVPKPALKPWAERMVAEGAYDHRKQWEGLTKAEAVAFLKGLPYAATERASVKGTDIHHWADCYIKNVPCPPPTPDQKPYCDAFLRFLEDWSPEFLHCEATIFNRTHRYAGTADFFARLRGLGLCLGDYKTGRGVWPEAALQMSGYRFGEFIGTPDEKELEVPAVDRCVVVHLAPETTRRGYELLPVHADREVFDFFLHAARVREFVESYGRGTIGTPLRPEAVGAA